MPLNIRDETVNELAAQLAKTLGQTKTESVKQALQNELRRIAEQPTLHARLRPIQQRVARMPRTGKTADKAFYDALSGDE